MRVPIQFCVKKEGKDMLPPKKRKPSMWGKKPRRLIELRTKALQALPTKPDTNGAYFKEGEAVRLTLEVHVGIPSWETLGADERRKALKSYGDLDNFITGVCDGLMAADENVLKKQSWHKDFNAADAAIHPRKSIAYEDDSQIVEICARKVVTGRTLGIACWYRVKLEGLTS